jgi:hypothetical protein
VAKAARVDADWRELGALAFRHKLEGLAVNFFARAHTLPYVLVVKFGSDAAHSAAAYLFGIAVGWFWGVAPYGVS